MSETISEIIGWLGAISEALFLVGGLLLGYLSQSLLDRSSAKRSAAAQLRQERQKVHAAFLMEANKVSHDLSHVFNRGVDENEKQHREFLQNSRPVFDLLAGVELLAEPATYKAANRVAMACMDYEMHSAVGKGMALQEQMKKYVAAVREELDIDTDAKRDPQTGGPTTQT